MFTYQSSPKSLHHSEWLEPSFNHESKICECNIIYINMSFLHDASSSSSTYNNIMSKKKIKERKKERKKKNKQQIYQINNTCFVFDAFAKPAPDNQNNNITTKFAIVWTLQQTNNQKSKKLRFTNKYINQKTLFLPFTRWDLERFLTSSWRCYRASAIILMKLIIAFLHWRPMP